MSFRTGAAVCGNHAKWWGRIGRSFGAGALMGWTLLVLTAPAVHAASPSKARAAGAGQPSPSTCFGKAVTIAGTAGDDVLRGTPGADVIAGGSGDDRIQGGGGNDLICAGRGNDVVHGGSGADRITGGPGADHLSGGAGTDRCWAGAGADDPPRCENPGFLRAGDVRTSTDASTPLTVRVLQAVANPDHRQLTVSAFGAAAGAGKLMPVANRKALWFEPAGNFGTLVRGETATAEARYLVTDHQGHSARARLTVVVEGTGAPPAAVADSAEAAMGQPLRIDVLANDTDPDKGAMRVTSVAGSEHAAVAIVDGGQAVEYRPAAGYCNDGAPPDQFTYTLNGGSSATVSVAVACATRIDITQGLFPSFDPSVTDYVVHCDGSDLQVSGLAIAGDSVAVDGSEPQTGVLAPVSVPLQADQEFTFTITGGESRAYHVRCLPSDFPTWEYQRLLPPDHAFYSVAPTLAFGGAAPTYAVVFDDRGVPVWWYSQPSRPVGAEVLEDGNVVWYRNAEGSEPAAFEIRQLNGTLVESVVAAGGSPTDIHEFQVLPNGDRVIITSHRQEHVDLTAYGGGSDESILWNDIQELEPGGGLVWEWSTQGHIGLDETDRWWPAVFEDGTGDAMHMNAVQPDGEDAFLVSLRHTDAVYKIDKASGEVLWKLGGTTTPQSLTVLGDPQGEYPLGGQHDVRLQSDGTVTVHDNNTNLPYPPRAARYEIDETERTATLVEERTDPEVPASICCGSARRSPDGSWLMSWGGNSLVTEFDAAGARTFRLGFGGAAFSYRAMPAPDGAVTAAALRAGMDAMHPRP